MEKLLLLGLACSLLSCRTDNTSLETINIQMNVNERSASRIDLSLCDTILLENSEQGLMYSIRDIVFGKDEICVQGKNKVALFGYDGTHIRDLGTQGRGPAEYLSINSIFMSDGHYCIFDSRGGKILKFDSKGDFVEYESLPSDQGLSFSALASLGNSDKYAVVNTYRGSRHEVPLLSIYDSSFKALAHSGRKVLDGLSLFVPFQVWKNEALFTSFFCDTIYALTPDHILPKYYLDFGEQALPKTIDGSSKMFDRISHWNLPESQSRYSVILNPVCQDEENLYIPYIYRKEGPYILCYHKRSGANRTFRLWDPMLEKTVSYSYLTVHSDAVYFVLSAKNNTVDNPLIIRVKSETFKL